MNVSLSNFGVEPRTWQGLLHMPTMLFVHATPEHLWNNVLAFFILTTTLFFFYYEIAIPVFLIIWVFSPILLFVIGSTAKAHFWWLKEELELESPNI